MARTRSAGRRKEACRSRLDGRFLLRFADGRHLRGEDAQLLGDHLAVTACEQGKTHPKTRTRKSVAQRREVVARVARQSLGAVHGVRDKEGK